MQKAGFSIHKDKVGDILKQLGFSLQQNQKMKQVGPEAEYRDKQFEHINNTVTAYIDQNLPVLSIDCKKKENIGNFKNNGADYRPVGKPTEVLDHDFPLKEGKAAPYGVYDIAHNEGVRQRRHQFRHRSVCRKLYQKLVALHGQGTLPGSLKTLHQC